MLPEVVIPQAAALDTRFSTMFTHYPLGHTINGSPHSVCASLPTMRDITGYEERDPRVCEALVSGYPRFITHPFVARLKVAVAEALGGASSEYFPVASPKAVDDLRDYVATGQSVEWGDLHWLRLPKGDDQASAQAFLQHTGIGISSREAEDVLVRLNQVPEAFVENRILGDSDSIVRNALHECYRTSCKSDIILARGGMNAFYAGFRALQEVQGRRGRHRWIQLGWLYVDTLRILERLSPQGCDPVILDEVNDFASLEAILEAEGASIAGIVTEIPTNPLLHSTDVTRLRALADRYGCALILDPTLASPHNVNVLPLADLHINSLTKYACSAGDVMIGAAALNRASSFYEALRDRLPRWVERPYSRDLDRLAAQIGAYGSLVRRVNRSAEQVVEFLRAHPAVSQVWWARQTGHSERFDEIAHLQGGIGCVISLKLKGRLTPFYDNLRMPKSPSFGTAFSMACPFLYLAHYDLVTTSEGRQRLLAAGIPHDLVRLSVGTEPIDDLLGILGDALECE